MKRIIHLSDIHVGYKDFDRRFERVAANLIAQKGDKPHDYVLVVTGDLVNNAYEAPGYGKVKAGFNTLKAAGFEHILIIPGNHDYGTGDMGDKRFVPEFQQAFYGRPVTFPKKDIIDDIAFFGLDSMAEELHWHDRIWAEGEIGTAQCERLANMLEEEEVRACRKRVVYLHHHPFKWRLLHQLKDAQKLKNVLQSAMVKGVTIDALLFGHNHQGDAQNGEWGIPRCYDAGTVTQKPRPKWISWSPWLKIKSAVRMIHIGEDDVDRDYIFPLL